MKDNWIVNLFYKVAIGPKKYRTILTPIGPLFFLGIIGLFLYASNKTDKIIGYPKLFEEPLNIIISFPIIILGIILIGWCVAHFIKAKGTPVPFSPPRSVVFKGPYAWSRNPMLTGLFILLLGIGLWLMSLSLILFYLPLFILLNYIELKKVEEPELEKRLGKEYIKYKKRTPMFIPWKRKSPN